MDIIKNNPLRVGNFTSSENVALITLGRDKKSFGAPALTYISECNMERRLGRSLTDESNARPLAWGSLCERRVNDLLPMDYVFDQNQTIAHPTIKCFTGSPDGSKTDTVAEIKAPMTLKSFCNLVDPIYEGLTGISAINAIRENHKDGDKFYWQIVSNSILINSKYAELIVYCPYRSELDSIRELAGSMDDQNLYKYYWIVNSNDDELPFLLDGGYYKNLNIINFEVPVEDKQLLLEKIEAASSMLIGFPGQEILHTSEDISTDEPQKDYGVLVEIGKELRKKAGL